MTISTWRLLIGPYHTQYPWYNHHEGTVEDLAYATTLTGAMTAGSTANIALTSGASFPSAGGVWVGPVNSGEGWEYVVYDAKSTNTLTGIHRENSAVRDHNGAHGVGAAVKTWYPIMNDDGNLSFTETMDDTYSVITWTTTISGFIFPQHVMRNNHIAIIQTNDDGAGWANYLVGFIDSPTATGDHTNKSPWSINIRTIDVLLQAEVKPLRIGGLDLAKEGTATGSTPLVLAFDERASGDYTAAAPSFDASNVLDRNTKTLWIGERFMGTEATYSFPNADSENQGGSKFDQVYVNPPPGTPAGAKWIQLIQTGNRFGFQGLAINEADSSLPPGDTRIWLLKSGEPQTYDYIILCENEAVFRQLNPLANPALIQENATFFHHLFPTGGQLWMRLGELNKWTANMAYGDAAGYIHHDDAPDGHDYSPTITAPATGETMRYLHAASAASPADYWETSMVKSAGYKISNDNDQWVAVELPGLGLKLTEAITASVPASGSLLKLSDSAGPSNSGLPASGRLSIGDEQIDYSAKVDGGVTVSGRGANSTVAAIHEADDTIFIVESGVLTDAHLLGTAGWRRYGGSIVPDTFKLWRSILQTPRSPEEEDWADDWIQIGSQVTGNTASTWDYTMSPSVRCKHIMFTISEMSVDPARVRLNEVVATIDNSAYDTSLWLANGVTAGAVISQLITNAGLSSANILTDLGDTTALYDQTTADDTAWSVISDLAEFAGCRLTVGRDSRIIVADENFWETGTTSVGSTWSKSNAADIQASLRNGVGTSRVKLKWRTPNSSSSGVEMYPAFDSLYGKPIETAELIYPSAASAQVAAQKRYLFSRYPYEFTVNSAVSVPFTRPGEIHSVTWQYNRDTLAIVRKALVKTIEHKLKGGKWLESLHLIQLEREAEY